MIAEVSSSVCDSYAALFAPITFFFNDSRLNVCMYGHTYSKNMDQPGKVANPARGQLNREENEHFPVRVHA